jgi:branched-chain amino acid transport system permease protein
MIARAVNAVADRTVGRWLIAALLLVLILFPLLAGEEGRYYTVLLMTVFIFATLGHAWNLLAGFSGLLSFGIQVYVGLAGFTVAILSYYFGVPVWWAMLLSIIVTTAFALLQAVPLSERHARRNTWIGVGVAVALWVIYEIIVAVHPEADIFGGAYIRRVILLFLIFIGALPLLKLQGAYFAVATWLIAAAVASIFNEWRVVGAGGGMNIANDTSIAERYYAGLILVLVASGIVWWLLHSRYGQALTAVRDDEEAAMAVGIDIRLIKTIVFLISAPLAGLAAALYYIDAVTITPPDAFGIRWSAYAVFVVVAGGMGTLAGPIIGAVLFIIVQRFLVATWGGGDLTLGIAAVLIILLMPRGIAGLLGDLRVWAAAQAGAAARPALADPVALGRPGAIVFAGLLPSSPAPHLLRDVPAWAGLRAAYAGLAERLAASGADTLVILSTDRAPPPGRHPVPHVRGRAIDPDFATIGDIAYDLDLDLALIDALGSAGLRCHAPDHADGFAAGRAAAAIAEARLRRLPVVVIDVSGLSATDAARTGETIADVARRSGRGIALLALTGLSGSATRPDLNAEPGGIASADHDAANRQILGWLQSGDAGAVSHAAPGLAGTVRMEADGAVLVAVAAAAGTRWRGGDVLSYAAIFGAGAAVVDLRIESMTGATP